MLRLLFLCTCIGIFFFFSSRRRNTRCALVTGVQTCALPIWQYTQAGRLHSAYSFALMQPDSSAQRVRDVIAELEQHITAPAAPCYALSNHDKPRVASRWLNGRNPNQHAKEMLALLFSMRGDICMYQGEELGLPQADVPYERIKDTFGKNFWPKFKGQIGRAHV